MCSVQLKLLLLFCSLLAQTQHSAAIINRPNAAAAVGQLQATRSGSYYLNEQRPLWVLEDQVQQPSGIEQLSYTTAKPYYFYQQRDHWRRAHNTQRPLKAARARHIKLPRQYLPERQQPQQQRYATPYKQIPIRRQQWQPQSDKRLSMPTFDSLPGDENAETLPPIFIYNGPKGELILNTMMSARKYPMQEPVPGQILYPPTAPIFRPKPIVQRFRAPGRQLERQREHAFNLTLIPFYAHEAIDPRHLDYEPENLTLLYNSASTSTTTPTTTTPIPPTVLYAAPGMSLAPAPIKVGKKRRLKKTKQYAVYRTPYEVHWRPSIPTTSPPAYTPTTPFPLTLASPLQNHRYSAELDTPTTPQPLDDAKFNYQVDEADPFQIVYVDESLEKPPATEPTPTQATTLPGNTHYELSKEYYAFPVYTLGKLLAPAAQQRSEAEQRTSTASQQKQIEEDNITQDDTDTWFILNSRYKGPEPQRHNNKYRLSSKYTSIHNSAYDNTPNSIINF